MGKLASDQVREARKMRDQGLPWTAIVAKLGVHKETIQRAVVAGFRDNINQRLRAAYRVRANGGIPPEMYARRTHKAPKDSKFEPPPQVIAESIAARSHPLTINQSMFGDPLPGRSALDRRGVAG